MSSWHTSVGLIYTLSLNVASVRATGDLPLAQSSKPEAILTTSKEVTFDPLGVAAVLHNPRASLSAARLYTQYDRKFFIWPHTMMMGATLIPVNVLVEHLTATFQSIHPAITLCTQDTQLLSVVSNMVFKELPLDFSNMWLGDVIAFKASTKPANDFMIVCMDDDDGTISSTTKGGELKGPSKMTRWLGCSALNMISLINGLIIVAGIVLGTLSADIWALTLFFFYGTHWLAGLAVSTTSLVTPQKISIKPDPTTRYAIYQRPAGGTVVFKGRQDTMESWARSTWEFNRTFKTNSLHWFWTLTGTMSAICSVACMVNMIGYMQLAFLALLVYASLAEIGATRITRLLQGEAKANDRTCFVDDNAYRTQGIIRATVEFGSKYRLKGLDWVDMKRMPPDQIFKDMQTLLARFNEFQEAVETGTEVVPADGPEKHEAIKEALRAFQEHRLEDPVLVKRIQTEATNALKEWWKKLSREDVNTSTEKKVVSP
ncbi:hypothetical protein TMatcc_009073 [Talaromyces marneffei ATCC 18224]|uniref:Uncharacterized protein n=2 Tax=Talaromyces marneffei TaxID=37727 RepID=B6QNM2_TALMQ|nr:uncharacterized protein EYB26_008366 [Talaromyces marneffei]EEA21510.1 conserved hypothetical protein [Talaromyces marneffei ATCC 18224]KAE8550997.1 hypothetical protein EYB25_007229 [Talaromyces marneffei]QGA20660.1 hypothetical protein EYB26_008366 [Talaromyces marneffei]